MAKTSGNDVNTPFFKFLVCQQMICIPIMGDLVIKETFSVLAKILPIYLGL